MQESESSTPDVKKRLVTPMDNRTAMDSLRIVAEPGNVVRPVNEPFNDPYNGRTFMHPPNRPNDRSRIVFWREGWGDGAQKDQAKAEAIIKTRQVEARMGTGKIKGTPVKVTEERQKAKEIDSGTKSGTPKAAQTSGPVDRGRSGKEIYVPRIEFPPAEPFVPGVHCRRMTLGSATNEESQNILSVLPQSGFGNYLRERKIAHVQFMEKIEDRFDHAGLYDPITDTLSIQWPYRGPSIGHLVPGERMGVGECGRDAIESQRINLIHEEGYHLFVGLSGQRKLLIERIYADNKGKTRYISGMASMNAEEWFSENLAAYVFYKEPLRRHDPMGYKTVDDALKFMRIEVP